jgi:redox-sensitive bicupin YhaK (pirin superfamily)
MITIRPGAERGRGDFGWLQARYTFSFNRYYDPEHIQFRSLRVINEDRVRPGAGFGEHGHADMEILTWVLSGAIEHRDSLGHGAVLRPGEVQRMTAGKGIRHSEFNPSADEPLHLLQVWIVPTAEGIEPEYEQRAYPLDARRGRLCLVASEDGREDSMRIHANASLAIANLDPGQPVHYTLAEGRGAWLQVARGRVRLNGVSLEQGDGAAIEDEPSLEVLAEEPAEILLFDLA